MLPSSSVRVMQSMLVRATEQAALAIARVSVGEAGRLAETR